MEVAWDALGGRFAINGGGLDAPPGEVCYWGPDTLDWQSIGGGHSAFITWALSDAIGDFYGSLRWPGWEGEVERLAPDQGLSLVPPPFTVEGRDPAQVSRSAVPMTELHGVYADLAEQLRETPDGSAFKLKVTEWPAKRTHSLAAVRAYLRDDAVVSGLSTSGWNVETRRSQSPRGRRRGQA